MSLQLQLAAASAGLLDLDLSFVAELVAFLVMLGILARWAYPRIIQAATERQRRLAEQLEAAERARREAEERLQEAERRLQEARAQAAEVLEAAARSAEQLREELRRRAQEEAQRILEGATREIEIQRQRLFSSVRAELADLVVAATEKVLGESLDGRLQRHLVERAIAELDSVDGGGGG